MRFSDLFPTLRRVCPGSFWIWALDTKNAPGSGTYWPSSGRRCPMPGYEALDFFSHERPQGLSPTWGVSCGLSGTSLGLGNTEQEAITSALCRLQDRALTPRGLRDIVLGHIKRHGLSPRYVDGRRHDALPESAQATSKGTAQ